MTIATNPQTGETLFLGKDGAWQKAQTAVNPQTKEMLAFDGEGWKPVPARAPQGAATFDQRFQEPAALPNGQELRQGLLDSVPVVRGSFLPITKNLRTGETSFDLNSGITGAVTGAVRRAVSLPGEVLKGDVDPEGKEAIGRVLELASIATPILRVGGTSTAAPSIATKVLRPETNAIKEMASAAYKKADDAGVVIAQPAYTKLAGDIASTVRKAGFHPKIHPKVAGALEEVAATIGKEPSLADLEIVRRIAQSAAKSIEKDERRVARIVVDKIDDFVQGLSASTIKAGDPEAGAAAILEARSLWRTASKAEAIEGLVEKAGLKAGQYSGSGYENALRTVFRSFANNPKAMRTFSKEEQDAIQKVAKGGKVQNILRYIGKLAPTGIVSGALGGGIGYQAAGVLGAATVMSAGVAARFLATQLAKRNVIAARNVMVKGLPGAKAAVPKEVVRAQSFYGMLLNPARITGTELTNEANR